MPSDRILTDMIVLTLKRNTLCMNMFTRRFISIAIVDMQIPKQLANTS